MNITIKLPKALENQVIEAANSHGERLEVFIASIIQQYLIFHKVDEELEKASLEGKEPGKKERIAEAVERSQEFHREMLAKLREKDGSIRVDISHEEKVKEFDELSEKVARALPFENWQEAGKFMRGSNHYDFDRQQYLHH